MKKILTVVLLITIAITSHTGLFTPQTQASNYFIVTAYYSPLPDQEYYITGNYQDELILNGQGIAGASGKSVFSGMLAAPGNYPFGTKIYLDGLGIGEVSDRGGAIVNAGKRGYEHDRIDIWMGYGDEGLRRANFWGKRKVYGYVVDPGNAVTLDYTSVPAPLWATVNLKKAYKAPATPATPVVAPTPTVFDQNLGKGSNPVFVEELQTILRETGFLGDEYLPGDYDAATIDAVYSFQVAEGILSAPTDAGAGYFGPTTRKTLKTYYSNFTTYQSQIDELMAESTAQAQSEIASIGNVAYGDISPQVRALQKTLAKLGYFHVADTAIFGPQTQNSLITFQVEMGIISDENQTGAGVFGPQTRETMQQKLAEIYQEEKLQEAGIGKDISHASESTHQDVANIQTSIYSF